MIRMNRAELVAAVSDRTGLSATDCGAVLDALGDVMRECAADGTRLQVPGLLTLERVERPARTGRNPQTGEPMDIAASYGVRLTAGTTLKAAAKDAKDATGGAR